MDFEATQLLDSSDCFDDQTSQHSSKYVASLKFLPHKEFNGQTFEVKHGSNVIGRHENADIFLPIQKYTIQNEEGTIDKEAMGVFLSSLPWRITSLSKKHASIEATNDIFMVIDHNSRNKTRKNNVTLTPEVRYEIKAGDLLVFSDLKCQFLIQNIFPADDTASLTGSDTCSESMLPINDSLEDCEIANDSEPIPDSNEMFSDTYLMMETQNYCNESVLPDIDVNVSINSAKILSNKDSNKEELNEQDAQDIKICNASGSAEDKDQYEKDNNPAEKIFASLVFSSDSEVSQSPVKLPRFDSEPLNSQFCLFGNDGSSMKRSQNTSGIDLCDGKVICTPGKGNASSLGLCYGIDNETLNYGMENNLLSSPVIPMQDISKARIGHNDKKMLAKNIQKNLFDDLGINSPSQTGIHLSNQSQMNNSELSSARSIIDDSFEIKSNLSKIESMPQNESVDDAETQVYGSNEEAFNSEEIKRVELQGYHIKADSNTTEVQSSVSSNFDSVGDEGSSIGNDVDAKDARSNDDVKVNGHVSVAGKLKVSPRSSSNQRYLLPEESSNQHIITNGVSRRKDESDNDVCLFRPVFCLEDDNSAEGDASIDSSKKLSPKIIPNQEATISKSTTESDPIFKSPTSGFCEESSQQINSIAETPVTVKPSDSRCKEAAKTNLLPKSLSLNNEITPVSSDSSTNKVIVVDECDFSEHSVIDLSKDSMSILSDDEGSAVGEFIFGSESSEPNPEILQSSPECEITQHDDSEFRIKETHLIENVASPCNSLLINADSQNISLQSECQTVEPSGRNIEEVSDANDAHQRISSQPEENSQIENESRRIGDSKEASIDQRFNDSVIRDNVGAKEYGSISSTYANGENMCPRLLGVWRIDNGESTASSKSSNISQTPLSLAAKRSGDAIQDSGLTVQSSINTQNQLLGNTSLQSLPEDKLEGIANCEKENVVPRNDNLPKKHPHKNDLLENQNTQASSQDLIGNCSIDLIDDHLLSSSSPVDDLTSISNSIENADDAAGPSSECNNDQNHQTLKDTEYNHPQELDEKLKIDYSISSKIVDANVETNKNNSNSGCCTNESLYSNNVDNKSMIISRTTRRSTRNAALSKSLNNNGATIFEIEDNTEVLIDESNRKYPIKDSNRISKPKNQKVHTYVPPSRTRRSNRRNVQETGNNVTTCNQVEVDCLEELSDPSNSNHDKVNVRNSKNIDQQSLNIPNENDAGNSFNKNDSGMPSNQKEVDASLNTSIPSKRKSSRKGCKTKSVPSVKITNTNKEPTTGSFSGFGNSGEKISEQCNSKLEILPCQSLENKKSKRILDTGLSHKEACDKSLKVNSSRRKFGNQSIADESVSKDYHSTETLNIRNADKRRRQTFSKESNDQTENEVVVMSKRRKRAAERNYAESIKTSSKSKDNDVITKNSSNVLFTSYSSKENCVTECPLVAHETIVARKLTRAYTNQTESPPTQRRVNLRQPVKVDKNVALIKTELVESVVPQLEKRKHGKRSKAKAVMEAVAHEFDMEEKERPLIKSPSNKISNKRQSRSTIKTMPNSPSSNLIAAPIRKMNVMFTGISSKAEEKIAIELGGCACTCVRKADVLVTDKVRRTVKFLCCLSRGIPIVDIGWLRKSKTAKKFVATTPFLLKDVQAEKQYQFHLKRSISLAKEKCLLIGLSFYISKNVKPDAEQMKDIIECGGGKLLLRLPRTPSDDSIVLSCEQDLASFSPTIKKQHHLVHNAEFLLSGILRQQLDYHEFVISHSVAEILEPINKRPKTDESRKKKNEVTDRRKSRRR